MADSRGSRDDAGLSRADRPVALGLIFRRHGRENVRPTVPTRVEFFRHRTGLVEAWEVIAWLPLSSEFIVWRRDTNADRRLKAKEFVADGGGRLNGIPVSLADHWTDEPVQEDVEPVTEPEPPARPTADKATLRALILGLTDPNSDDLARYGKKPL